MKLPKPRAEVQSAYRREDGLKGIEARYMYEGNTLYVKIGGSNHWTDYALNFLAWPRVRPVDDKRVKTHPVWTRWAWMLADHLKAETAGHSILVWEIIGHSMGGSVGTLMALFSDTCLTNTITSINAPKPGNRSAVVWMEGLDDILDRHDDGDIVRHLPLLYARWTDRAMYGATRPFWKAHNNKGTDWDEFPI